MSKVIDVQIKTIPLLVSLIFARREIQRAAMHIVALYMNMGVGSQVSSGTQATLYSVYDRKKLRMSLAVFLMSLQVDRAKV